MKRERDSEGHVDGIDEAMKSTETKSEGRMEIRCLD